MTTKGKGTGFSGGRVVLKLEAGTLGELVRRRATRSGFLIRGDTGMSSHCLKGKCGRCTALGCRHNCHEVGGEDEG